MRILLIEDEVKVARFLTQQLERLDYTVIHTVNGEEAVQQLVKDAVAFNLVLMDINLGAGINGIQTAKSILNKIDIPIVFLYSNVEPELIEETVKIASYGYVEKSSSSIVLDASIKMALKLFKDKIEREQMHKELHESVTHFNEIVAMIPAGIYIAKSESDGVFKFEYVSDRWCLIHNLRREDALKDFYLPNKHMHPDDRELLVERNRQASLTKRSFSWEGRLILGKDEIRWLRLESSPVLFENGVTRWFGVSQDITAQKKAEEEIKRQLAEKETLLREVHHRVKNNISNIESFLRLQIDSTGIPEAKEAIKGAITRVQSMRILYDNLLLSEDIRKISIKDYIENLINSIYEVFTEKDKVIIETQISDFSILAKQAITVGIILNELLTNVFKYAFNSGGKGIVSIIIEKTVNSVTVIIQDNGIGIDENIMKSQSPGFGLTIVKMLVEQLNGTYTVVSDKGTKSILQFCV